MTIPMDKQLSKLRASWKPSKLLSRKAPPVRQGGGRRRAKQAAPVGPTSTRKHPPFSLSPPVGREPDAMNVPADYRPFHRRSETLEEKEVEEQPEVAKRLTTALREHSDAGGGVNESPPRRRRMEGSAKRNRLGQSREEDHSRVHAIAAPEQPTHH
jgi:hypothetical protein